MAEVLTAASQAALEKGTIRPYSRVTIYRDLDGAEVATILENVRSYSFSHDRKFGAAQCSLECINPEGQFTYTNADPNGPNAILDAPTASINFPDIQFTNYSEAYQVDVGAYEVRLDTDSGAYYTTGSWVSEVIDGGASHVRWTSIEIDGETPTRSARLAHESTSIRVYLRYGDSSDVDETWSEWESSVVLSSDSQNNRRVVKLASEKRYIQMRAELVSDDGSVTPVLTKLEIKHKAGSATRLVPPDCPPLLYWGNKIRVEEGIYSLDDGRIQWFDKFYGIITGVEPDKNGSFATIRVEALDFMKILLQDKIEKPRYSVEDEGDFPFEPERFGPTRIELERVTTDSGHLDITPDEVGFVYAVPIEYLENPTVTNINPDGSIKENGDRKYINWVKYPSPVIFVNGKEVNSEYELDHANGAVFFRYQKDPSDKVEALFFWYNMNTNRFEEVLAQIIMDGYRSAGYDETWVVDNEENSLDLEYDPEYHDNEAGDANDLRVEWVSSPSGFRISLDMSYPRATIPRTVYRIQDNKSHFDAAQDLLRYVNPTYRVFADEKGNFVGRYQPQKQQEDFKLVLTKSIATPVSESSLFTRVVAFGQSPSGTNVAPQGKIHWWNSNWGNSGAHGIYRRDNRDAPNPIVVIDSNVNSNIGFWAHNEVSPPYDMIIVKLKAPIRIGRVDLLVGNGPEGRAISGVGTRIQVSPDGEFWYDLSDSMTTIEGSTSEWISVSEDAISDVVKMMKMQYVKLIATKFGSYNTILYAADYAWAVKELQVWTSTEIRAEATVFDIVKDPPEIGYIHPRTAESLVKRIGTKTHIIPVNPALDTEEKVLARAKDYLYEICRTLHRGKVEVIYSPHLKVGMTVRLYDKELGIDSGSGQSGRLYYIDSITHSKSGFIPSVSLELTSWD